MRISPDWLAPRRTRGRGIIPHPGGKFTDSVGIIDLAMDALREILHRAIDEAETFEAACGAVVDLLAHRVAHYDWVGVYLQQADELVLGAWAGPEATQHVRIPVGQGICGLAARSGETVVVDEVGADPRYLACFPHTHAEIVVPIRRGGWVIGEIDIDSDQEAAFSQEDRAFLEDVAELLGNKAYPTGAQGS
jgi:L-methionine (R)-S-oxide reductase